MTFAKIDIFNSIHGSSKQLESKATVYKNETVEKKGYLSDDVKFNINNMDPFDYNPVYYGLPAYDYNTGKRLK